MPRRYGEPATGHHRGGLVVTHRWTTAPLLLLLAACAQGSHPVACTADRDTTRGSRTVELRIDHHQHLLSEGARAVTVTNFRTIGDTSYARKAEHEPLVDAARMVRMLDEAGIAKALVFSNAYYFAHPAIEQAGEYEQVRAENDWTLAQVRRHPARLFAACSVNPRRGYAVAEIERCAASGGFRALKLHFGGSGVDLGDSTHVAGVRQAFATANRLRLPVVAHLRSEAEFGARQARTFLGEILPAAPDVPVTINHLWGGGRYGPDADSALSVFAHSFERMDPRVGNLWFDLAQIYMAPPTDNDRARIAEQMRRIGFARMLYGSDGPQWGGVPPRQHWEEFKKCMPLTGGELDTIAANVAPYLR